MKKLRCRPAARLRPTRQLRPVGELFAPPVLKPCVWMGLCESEEGHGRLETVDEGRERLPARAEAVQLDGQRTSGWCVLAF